MGFRWPLVVDLLNERCISLIPGQKGSLEEDTLYSVLTEFTMDKEFSVMGFGHESGATDNSSLLILCAGVQALYKQQIISGTRRCKEEFRAGVSEARALSLGRPGCPLKVCTSPNKLGDYGAK